MTHPPTEPRRFVAAAPCGGGALSLLAVALLLGLPGCPSEPTYTQLTRDGQCLSVRIEPAGGDDDDSAGDDDDSAGAENRVEIDLVPEAGIFDLDVIGTAAVAPATAAARTEFAVEVVLVDTGADAGNPTTAVDRAVVSVRNGAPEGGTSSEITWDELEMDPSPADPSRWRLTLVAGGDPLSTTRDDDLCVTLYSAEE